MSSAIGIEKKVITQSEDAQVAEALSRAHEKVAWMLRSILA